MKKLLLITVLFLGMILRGYSQINIGAGSTVNQDFSIGTSATAALPTGWKMDKITSVRTIGSYSTAVSATEQRAGNNMSSSATNGIYNFAAGDAATATDRAVGGISSSSASKSVNVYVQLTNNGVTAISDFTISYNVEKYRNGSNAAGFSIQMYYSPDGISWTAAGGDFFTSFAADADNNGYASAPGATSNVSNKTLSVSLAASSNLYLVWNYSVTSGSTTSNAQALGIDNVSITANGSSAATPPTLNADASNNDIDNNIDITFTDNALWRAAVTAIKIDGTPLTSGDYSLSSGNLQLKPSNGNSLLTTSGLKSVAVVATGYSDAAVTQQINAGAPTSNSTATIDLPLALNSTRTVTASAKDQYNNMVPGYIFKYDAIVTDNIATTDETYTIDGIGRNASVSDFNLTNVTNSSGVTTFDITIPSSVDSNDGVSLQVQLNDGTTSIGTSFSYSKTPPQITLTGIDPGTNNFYPGTTNNILYRIQVDVTNDPVILSYMAFYLQGDYHGVGLPAADIATNGIKLWYSDDASLTGTDALLKAVGCSGAGYGEEILFLGINYSFPVGTAYLFVTADIVDYPPGYHSISGQIFSNEALYFYGLIPFSGGSLANANFHLISNWPSYTWIGSDNADWSIATNWNPARLSLTINDILLFNDGTTKTIIGVPTQTIGRLIVSGTTTKITLQAGGSNILTIGGGTGTDLDVAAGCELNVSGTNALILALSSGAIGSINGNMTFAGGAHRLTSETASGILFNNGSIFTAGASFTGNAFGTTTPYNAIIFDNGSTYIAFAGSNPFGASQPNSVVIFNGGSLYKVAANLTPSFSGRNYSNIEIDAATYTLTTTGTSSVTMDNLTITNGTLNFNMTGNPGHTIKGNITITTGAVLAFNPSSTGTVFLAGNSNQIISNSGSLSFGSNSIIAINNNAGITIANDISMNNLSLTNGIVTTSGTSILSLNGALSGGSSSSYISGRLAQIYSGTGSKTFPIGKNGNYRQVIVNFLSLNAPSTLTAEQFEGTLPGTLPSGITLFNDRYWTVSQSGATNYSYSITLSGDGFTPFFPVKMLKGDGSSVIAYDVTSPNYTNTTAFTSFSDFGLGEIECIEPDVPTISESPSTICAGNNSTLSVTTGNLYDAIDWEWYSGSCGGTSVGSGTSIIVSPSVTTTYFVRGEGGCATPGTCADVTVTVNPTAIVSGYFNYYNSANTALNLVAIELQQSGVYKYGTSTNTSGYFEFPAVCPGTYDVVASKTKVIAGINSTDAAQVNYWAVHNSFIEKVRFLAGDVDGSTNIWSDDAGSIQQYFITQGNPTPAFDSDWSFWKTGELINVNPGPSGFPTITIPNGATSLTQNFYGLISGDFNRSFVPGSFKSKSESLTLNYGETMEVNQDVEFSLPIYSDANMEVGAISMILNFPSDIMDVTGVFLTNDPNTPLQYNVFGDDLRIGWNSLTPVVLNPGETLLTLLVKVNGSAGEDGIRIKLAGDPLNELADAGFDVISDAVLVVDIIKTPSLGTDEMSLAEKLFFSNHPNPFYGTTSFVYTLPVEGRITLEIYDIVGNKVMAFIDETQSAGDYIIKMEGNNLLNPGVYTARLRLMNSGTLLTRSIKIIIKNH